MADILISKSNSCTDTHIAVVVSRQRKIPGKNISKPCHIFLVRVDHEIKPQSAGNGNVLAA